MVMFKSKIPDIKIPSIGIVQYVFSNQSKIPEDKVLFIDGTTDKKLTFAELKSNSKKFAAGLHDKVNFKRGDVLSIFSPNQVW
jgi:4-coumarate--CoA ligase